VTTGTAVLVGWGHTYPGREHQARKTWMEFMEQLEQLKADGEITGFEPVLISPYGGDLAGFVLIHGEPDKLAAMIAREDSRHLRMRAELDHAHFFVTWASTGEQVAKDMVSSSSSSTSTSPPRSSSAIEAEPGGAARATTQRRFSRREATAARERS
jgi:hypothetical protein